MNPITWLSILWIASAVLPKAVNQRHQERIALEATVSQQEGDLKMHELRSRLRGRELKLELRSTRTELSKLKRSISGHKVRDVVLKLILPMTALAIVSGLLIFFFRKRNKLILLVLGIDVLGLIIISITYHFVKA